MPNHIFLKVIHFISFEKGKWFVFESTYPIESYFQTSCLDCFLKGSETSTNQCISYIVYFKRIRQSRNKMCPKNEVIICSFVSLFQPVPNHLLYFPDKVFELFFRLMAVSMLEFCTFSLPFFFNEGAIVSNSYLFNRR